MSHQRSEWLLQSLWSESHEDDCTTPSQDPLGRRETSRTVGPARSCQGSGSMSSGSMSSGSGPPFPHCTSELGRPWAGPLTQLGKAVGMTPLRNQNGYEGIRVRSLVQWKMGCLCFPKSCFYHSYQVHTQGSGFLKRVTRELFPPLQVVNVIMRMERNDQSQRDGSKLILCLRAPASHLGTGKRPGCSFNSLLIAWENR